MRLIIAIVSMLLFGMTANAALVTFENLPTNDSCGFSPVPCLESIATPEGFEFSHTGSSGGDGYEEVRVVSGGPDGNYLTTFFDPQYGADLRITHESGNAFDLHSLDTNIQFDYVHIRGYDQSDSQIAYQHFSSLPSGWGSLSFDNSWNSVHSVVIEGYYFCSFGCAWVPNAVDNISASVVPVPAAFWLFGSALAGLAWLRRKQLT